MASRGRTPTLSDGFDRDCDSSPDPLALSLNENKPKSARKATPRNPLATTSPSKQNRRSSVSEFEFSSPSKAMVMNTPRMGSASPWRIKVTVQAEPGSDEENAHSPSVKRITRTQTTTIPLKDADAPAPVKRGRGRPKKSDTGATPKAKRAGTPVKRTARSRSRDTSLGAVDTSAADIDTDAPPKRKRGRPRKTVQPPTEDEDVILVHVPQVHSEASVESTPVPVAKPKPTTSQKSTRFATPQVSVPDIQTTDATPQPPPSMPPQDKKQNGTHLMLPTDRGRGKSMAEYELPVVDTPPQTELGQRLRARKGTPHSKKAISITISSDEESDQDSDVLTPTSGDECDEPKEAMQDLLTLRTSTDQVQEPSNHPLVGPSDPQADSSASAGSEEQHPGQPFEDDDDEELQDVTNFAFDEGATRMPDDTTVIDSESFSMISVDSLPSSGGLTSPPRPEESNGAAPQIGSMLQHKHLKPSMGSTPNAKDQAMSNPSPGVPGVSPGMDSSEDASRPKFRRYVTPVIDAANPPVPPVIEPVHTIQPKTETPRLGRVVTAGVALQGVLDPSRLTPEPSQKMLDEKRDRLDDLFRGFSEGTRRELQAGLRLGEQLAQGQLKELSPPARSSPIRSQPEPEAAPKGGVFKTQRKPRQPRLLTPEDQEDDVVVAPATEPEVNDVEYPSLKAPTEMSLPSPAGSDDEMSWRVDTPPAATGNTEHMHSVNISDNPKETSTADQANNQPQQEDYSDIWQEEASRSSNSAEADDVPQVQDLFESGPVVPARGKLPRTWRRESGNHFQYSDEAESPQQSTSHHEVSRALAEADDAEEHAFEDEDVASDASDDTGMFFQSNMPNIFSKRHSRDLKQKKADKLDLTLLMHEGESLVPESSPPVISKKSSSATQSNPFLNTPPRFPGFPSSPQKSSPLRRELRGSDISSESHSRFQDESSLPLAQSSPFHTYVDGESIVSVASDQRQLQMEMEGVTDSSIRRVRNEADGYLDAYEPQERSLDEIEEVTEPSRTWHRNTSMVASSPPKMKMLSPVRKRVALFQNTPEKPRSASRKSTEPEATEKSKVYEENGVKLTTTHEASAVEAAPADLPQQRPTGILTRMTSSLWSAVSRPAAAVEPTLSTPPLHPILAKLTPLPRIEPWTKTHYKTLDKLYNVNQKHPALFSSSTKPSTSLSQTNSHLLKKFLTNNKQPYVGAVFSAWGYEFDMSEELVVLCQVFCELMSLDSIKAYETLKGREIEMGDCLPGKNGDVIDGEEVVRRLATVILGEEVRADEKKGQKIDRSRGLEVQWPQ